MLFLGYNFDRGDNPYLNILNLYPVGRYTVGEFQTEFSLQKIGDDPANNATLIEHVLSTLRDPNSPAAEKKAAPEDRGNATPCQAGLPDCHIDLKAAAESRTASVNQALQDQVKSLHLQQQEDLKEADRRLDRAKEGLGTAGGLFASLGIYATAAQLLQESSVALPRPLAFAAKVVPALLLGGAVNNEISGRNLYDRQGYIENTALSATNFGLMLYDAKFGFAGESLTKRFALFAGTSLGESALAGAVPYLGYKSSLKHAGDIQSELLKLNQN